MFQVKPPQTINTSLSITGQGRDQTLKLVYRHKPRKEYAGLLQAIAKGKKSAEDAVLALVESWEADAELTAAVLKQLDEDQPGTLWAILTGYGKALTVAREEN